MSIYRKHYILSEILMLSDKHRVSVNELSKITGISQSYIYNFLKTFKNIVLDKGYIYITDKSGLVIEAWMKGLNITEIALRTGWKDLEKLCSVIMKRFGYRTYRNFRFKYSGKNREIDVLALSEPIILLGDCKLWRRARVYQLKVAAKLQKDRARLFSEALHHSNLVKNLVKDWKYAKIYPMIITVLKSSLKIYGGVPVIPLVNLKGFLLELEKFDELLDYEVVET